MQTLLIKLGGGGGGGGGGGAGAWRARLGGAESMGQQIGLQNEYYI